MYGANLGNVEFSITITILPISSVGGRYSILSHSNTLDGIWIEGSKVFFGVAYTNAPSSICSYDFEYAQVLHVFAVHTKNRNSLYVNGVLVDEVEITPEQQAATYKDNGGYMYLGGSQGAGVSVNELAFFEYALPARSVNAIYENQTNFFTGDVPAIYGGELIKLDDSFRKSLLGWEWSDAEDWDRAYKVRCNTEEDTLYPEFIDGLSQKGQWLTSVVMYSGPLTLNVKELNVTYTGQNVKVSVSFDGNVWNEVDGTSGYDFNPYRKDLYVKVDFEEGHEEAYLDNLVINAYVGNTETTTTGRTVTYTFPTATLRPHKTMELHQDWGMKVVQGGSLTLSYSGPDPTVEYWYKPDTDIDSFATAPLPGGFWIDGVDDRTNRKLLAGRWYLIHNSQTTNSQRGNIIFNAPGTYGSIGLWPSRVLTNEEVEGIYKAYTSRSKTRADDGSAIKLTENANSAAIYATDSTLLTSN
jgi:hypothetical protein